MATDAVRPYEELAEELAKAGGESLALCWQCGVCTASCPWSEVGQTSLRKMLRLAQLGVGGLEGDFLWQCTACRACVARCPRGVEVIDVIRAARRFSVGMGMEPDRLKTVRGHLSTVGSEWGGKPEERMRWAEGLRVRPYARGMDLLLYVGCTASYDPRIRPVARALVRLLDAAGVKFGVLGEEEVCGGDPALAIGDPDLFRELATRNIEAMHRHGVERVVAISPHSYHVLRNEYPKLGGTFAVEHYTQLLASLVDGGKLPLRSDGAAVVSYHDPCFLGRHNGVFEEPRKILENVPGARLAEMERVREDALCCGGGGGRIFQETPPEQRFSTLRVAQAERVGATTLASACPYCVLNLEDSAKGTGRSNLQVLDVAEILAAHLAPG